MADADRLAELERRVDELAALLAELLQERRAGIPGPKEFTKQASRTGSRCGSAP